MVKPLTIGDYGKKNQARPTTEEDHQMDPAVAAHDSYRAAFAAHASNPTPATEAHRDAAKDKYDAENAKQKASVRK